MKNKLNIALRCTSVVAAILALLSLLLKFAKTTTKVLTITKTEKMSTGKWLDSVKELKDNDFKGATEMGNARIFLFITIVVLIVLIAILVANYFVKMKALTFATCGAAVVSCVSTLVFFINIQTGLNKVNDTYKALAPMLGGAKVTISPDAGVILFIVFGFVAAAAAIACAVQSLLAKSE